MLTDVIREALKEDREYYIGWQAGIAKAFQDEHQRQEYKNDHDRLEGFQVELDIEELSNNAAKNFLEMIIKE